MSTRYQNNGSTLWMGDIDENMNEVFIRTSFNLMNQNPIQVKVVRNKSNGQPIGYGFVSFENEETAQKVLTELNGKQMPNAIQGKRFRLNKTSSKEEEFSIYVGDLSPEVNDNMLFTAFVRHFPSVCSAKVVMATEGQSRRFGFVRFNDENEYRRALTDCDHSLIVGSNPISVRAAKPRRQRYPYNSHYKSQNYESVASIASESFVAPQQQQQPQQTEVTEGVYGSEMNPYYSGLAVSGHPVYVYPMMPFSALQPVNYEPYVYGQQPYGQQVYYPSCDNMTYSLMPAPVYVDHGHNQFLDSDKLNEDMIAKNEV